MTYIIDPKDNTKVIDTSIQPPSIDPIEIEKNLAELKSKVVPLQTLMDNINTDIQTLQSQLDAIYTEVPAVRPLEDN